MAREPLDRRQVRATFQANIIGAQAADLTIPITNSRTFTYDSAAPPLADDGEHISRYYQSFAIQTSLPTGPATAKNVQVQINVIGGDNNWVAPPASYTSDDEGVVSPALLSPGEAFFMNLPTPGVEVRLVVTKPVAADAFSVLVLMTDNSERALR